MRLALICLGIENTLDAVLTTILIESKIAYESMPHLAYLYQLSPAMLVLVKLAMFCALLGLVLMASERVQNRLKWGIAFAAAVYAPVIVYECWLFFA